MPWIEGRTNPEPGGYYDQARDGGPVRLLQVLPNGYVLMPDGLRAPAGAVFMSHRKSLRIPSPSVLLAMEKFIAAERARRKQRNEEVKCVGGYIASDVLVERAHAQHIADAEWYALARAEAQERRHGDAPRKL